MNLLEKTKTQDLTVHFIHFDSDEDVWSDVKLRGMKDLFSEKYPSLRFESHLLGGADILTAYDEFIRIYKVDVISMITHRRSLLTRMFNPSMARKIVFHTNTPMLVFHS